MILFADCEGDNLVDDITRLWTIQIAEEETGFVEVYADQYGYSPISEGLARLKSAEKVVFHNAFGFDFFAINKLYPETLRREQIIDTLIISRLIDSTVKRHSLADLGERLGFPKLDFHDFSKFSEEMVTYGKADVQILQRAWKGNARANVPSFGDFYAEFTKACELEFGVAYVIELQRQHGFAFNVEKAQKLESDFAQEMLAVDKELQKAFPPITHVRYSSKLKDKLTGKPKRLKDEIEVFNPGSRDHIASRLKDKYKWKSKVKTPTGKPKIDEDVLDALSYPEAKLCSTYMKIGKKSGMLSTGDNAWLKLARKDPDGVIRIHGEVNTLGTRTHRMAHYKPNLGQVDSDERMRTLFEADPGDILVGVDADGLELRMLAHYLFKYDAGVYAQAVHSGSKEDGSDAHSRNMRNAGLYLRDSAKTAIYAYLYGAGDKKLGQIASDDLKEAKGRGYPDAVVTAQGKRIRNGLETGTIGLQDLVLKCKRSHDTSKALPGLDGRWIPSQSDYSALNTLLQGNGSIVMKKAQVILQDKIEKEQLQKKIKFCATVHDEFQLSVHPDYVSQAILWGEQSITEAGVALGVRCPLVGTGNSGHNWSETH